MGKDVKGVTRGACRVGGCDCTDYVCPTQPNNFRCEYCGHYPADHLNSDLAKNSSFEQNPYAQSPVSPNPYCNPYNNPYGSANPYGSNPYGASPYGGNPYGGSPYGGNPYGGSPYGPLSTQSAVNNPPQTMPNNRQISQSQAMPSTEQPAPQRMPVSQSQLPPQDIPSVVHPSQSQLPPQDIPSIVQPSQSELPPHDIPSVQPSQSQLPLQDKPSTVEPPQIMPKPEIPVKVEPAPAPQPQLPPQDKPVIVDQPAPVIPAEVKPAAEAAAGPEQFTPTHDPLTVSSGPCAPLRPLGAPADPFASPDTHDPFASPDGHDPFAPSHDPFAPTHDPFAPTHDPFASSKDSSNPFAGRGGNKPAPQQPQEQQPPMEDGDFPPVVPPASAAPCETGGWPVGTISQIKTILGDVPDAALNSAMNSIKPSAGIDSLLNHFIEGSAAGPAAGGGEWPDDIIDRLAEALPETFSRERIQKVVASYEPKGDVDGVLALLFSENDSVPSFECQLCFTEYKVDEMYTVDCPSSHRFCFDCIQRMIEMNIRENTPVKCPGEGCDHTLGEDEVRQISQAAGAHSIITQEMLDKYSQQVLMRCVKSIPGIIGCPTPGCKNWIIPSDMTRKERCQCSSCGASFCSLCKGPYHYHCDCNDVRRHQQRWMEWVTTERMRYNHDKAEAVAKINAARAEIDRRNQEIMKKYNDMLADEQFKRENGRYCPKCHRVIIKEGGCDLMICGRNWHGGNIQDGCGHHFKWSEAKPYQSTLAKPNQEQANINIPDIAREFVHTGVVCDICHQEIKGLRFSCLNCPSCDFCERCEMEGTMAHQKDHIFQIIAKELYG